MATPQMHLIRQTPPHLAYVFASLLGLVFDLIVVFSIILIALGVFLIGVTLLLPVFFGLLSAIGYPFPENLQDLLADLRDLNEGTLLRSFMLLPPIAIVMIRERIARPFRTWRGLIVSFVLSLPAILVVVDLIAFSIGLYPYERASGADFLLNLLEVLTSRWEPGDLQSAAISLIFMPWVLSGFVYLPYGVTYLIWRTRLGGIQHQSRHTSVAKPATPLRFATAFLTQPDTRYGVMLLFLACLFGSACIAATALPPPGWIIALFAQDLIDNGTFTVDQAIRFAGLVGLLFWTSIVTCFVFILYISFYKPRLVSVLMIWAAIAAIVYIIFLIPSIQNSPARWGWIFGAIYFGLWIIPFAGLILKGYSALLRAGSLANKTVVKGSLSGRPTILLLRCFALDQTRVKRSGHIVGILDIFSFFTTRLEEVIVRETFLQAPVVAVANPKEDREPLGALREYLSDDDWQPFVSDKIAQSEGIVFVLGRGNYTGWETQKILDSGALNKVVFIVPPNPLPALDYLAQNPSVTALIGGNAALAEIKTGRVRGFVSGKTSTTFVRNQFKSELSYRLAVRRLLLSIEPASPSQETRKALA